jgi:cytosine permease
MQSVSADRSKLDRAATALPLAARMPRASLTMVWWSQCGAMFYLIVGAALAVKYGTRNALIGMLISVVLFSIVNGLLARYSVRTGLSCSALSRAMLGAGGGAVATLILCLTAVFYAVFEGSVLAIAATKVFPHISYSVAAIVIVLYSVPLVLGSVQRWLNRFNGVLLPLFLLGLALIVVVSIRQHGYSSDWLHMPPASDTPWGWLGCVAPYMGVFVLSMCTVDFGRFGRPADASFHAFINFGLPFYVMAFLINGAAGIFLVGSVDPSKLTETTVVDMSLEILGSTLGLLWIWVIQTRINTANYFLAIVNLQAFLEEAPHWRWSKVQCAALIGAVVLLLMYATDIFSYLLVALSYLGAFAAAWVGIALSHVLPRLRHGSTEGVLPAGHGGVLAWVIGALAGCAIVLMGGSYAALSGPSALLIAMVMHQLSGRSVTATVAHPS